MELIPCETWRPVVGYEGLYEVSSIGNIKAVAHRVTDSAGRDRFFPGRVLSVCYGKNPKYSYGHVTLRRGKCQSREWVHRLVASAFIPNPCGKPQVNHIDGNKRNNRVENLEWCTVRENLLHSFAIGLHPNEYFEKEAGKRAVIVISPSGDRLRFDAVKDAAEYMGYKYASHLSRDLHKNGGNCINGFLAFREDEKKN